MAKAERTGQRMERGARRWRNPDMGHYFIVTDTAETEKNYFIGFRNSLPQKLQGRIVIEVAKAKTNKLVETCESQAALDPQYAERWIVFDRDKVPRFDEIIAEAERKGIQVGWSNPCIEIWFQAYFGGMYDCPDSVACCRKFSSIYEEKTGREYSKSNDQLYAVLNQYGDEAAAVRMAKTRLRGYLQNDVKKPSNMCPCTTVHKLIGEVKDKVYKI